MQVNITSKWKDLDTGGKDKDKYLLQNNCLHYLAIIDNFFSITHP